MSGRWILCAVLLVGCGYRAAMERAGAAQSRKDWAEAAAGYEAALQHDPGDEDAARGLVMAQRRWHTQSLSRFEKSLSDSDLPAARAALRQAEAAQPGSPANTVAQNRLSTAEDARRADGLRTKARAQQAQGQPLNALRFWAKAQTVHATKAGADALKMTRADIVDRAAADEAAGRWADAEAAWVAIADIDPKAESARQALRDRWSAAWRADALAHESEGRLGPAVVRAAQVAAISGQAADLERRDQWRARLVAAFALRPEVTIAGASRRTQIVEEPLPRPATIEPQSPVLAIRGTLAPMRFSQSRTVKVVSARYQSGTRIERNPEWVNQRDALRKARRRRARSEQVAHTAERSMREAEDAMRRADQDIQERARRKRRRLRKALAQARDEEQRCQSAVRDARDGAHARARTRLQSAQRAVDDAWRALDTFAGSRRTPDTEIRAAERARSDLEDAREHVERARRKEADIEQDLDRLTPTVEVPRYATHRYPVELWTRIGEGRLALDVQLPDLPIETVPLRAQSQTTDRSHAAQMPLARDADPLRFPKKDAGLTIAVDESLGKAVARTIAAQEARWARSLVARALAAPTPAEQVRLAAAVILVRGAPSETIERARAILDVRTDLRDMAVLRAGLR